MTETLLQKRPHLISCIIAGVILLGALGDWPYGYYQLLRWITCGAAVWVAFMVYSWEKLWATWLFGIIAVLFNPLIPVHLSREIWQPIDLMCGALFLVIALVLKRPEDKEQKDSVV
jgi:hypothetical protein